MKGGHGAFHQQPYNEAVASNILKKLSCKSFVPYTLEKRNSGAVSKCLNFVTENTEYVPASLIRRRLTPKEGENYYSHFMRCCKKLGIDKKMKDALDYMLTFDYIIANEDRNYGNFGVIRNVETLKVLGAAPIFDNGNSLWYNQTKISHRVKAYPFALTQDEQIKFADIRVFPWGSLNKVGSIVQEGLSANPMCDERRVENIVKAVKERCVRLNRKKEPGR